MSRPLRVDVEEGWYHISARGIERRSIFFGAIGVTRGYRGNVPISDKLVVALSEVS